MADHDAAASIFSGLGEAGFIDDFVGDFDQSLSSAGSASQDGVLSESAPDRRGPDDSLYGFDPSIWSPVDDSSPLEPYDGLNTFGNSFNFAQPWDFAPQISHQALQKAFPDARSAADNAASLSSTAGQGGRNTIVTGARTDSIAESHRSKLFPNIQTHAQREELKRIAMPMDVKYHSPESETSSQSKADTGSSPEDMDSLKPMSRKRKSSAEEDDEDDDEDQPVKKTAHNMIEKRYRTNLNDKIAALRDSVPSLRIMSKSARGEDTTEDREELHGLTPAHKLNKATVLSKATEYIRHLEKRNTRLVDENHAMQQRIAAFEKLFMAGAMNGTISPTQQTPMPFSPEGMTNQSPMGGQKGPDPQGMIQVPEDMRRILAAQMAMGRPYPVPQQNPASAQVIMRQQAIQQQQQQQQQMQARGWANAGPYFGKLMVGSLAGLMIVEAVRENERSNEAPEGRGLLALPLQLVGRVVSSTHFSIAGYTFSTSHLLYQLKLLFLVGALLWVFVPSLFVVRPPKPEKAKQASASLEAVPSLASPIHVRRRAWLTAIQTVWIPRHNFLLEASALIAETMKLSIRNIIGMRGFQILTGLTEEQEIARVQAWNIALDAQLAGGDVEINRSRLTLTLLASGTLPITPYRLMLKALHIRVLLWQLGEKGLSIMIASKLARSQWNEAKQLNRILGQLRRSTNQASDDELPDHLGLLLEEDCDDVLNDEIVRRAHNLAWNQPTTHKVLANVDGMNVVVEDPAIRSPMDAVAAWWSCLTLQQALTASLIAGEENAEETRLNETDLDLAIKVAPIGSNAQMRALVVRAVLVDLKRGANIATALQVMAPMVNPDKHPSYRRGVPPLIDSPSSSILPDQDVRMALRCAMGIAHLQRYATPPRAALAVIDSILPGPAVGMSLMGCTAAFRLMTRLHGHAVASQACSDSLERLAGTLRIWIGGTTGERCGLDRDLRRKMVDRCLEITKSIVGMEPDPGYGTMSDCDSDSGGC